MTRVDSVDSRGRSSPRSDSPWCSPPRPSKLGGGAGSRRQEASTRSRNDHGRIARPQARAAARARPPLRLPKAQAQKLPNGLEIAVVEMHEVPVVDVTCCSQPAPCATPTICPGSRRSPRTCSTRAPAERDALEIAEEIEFLGATLSTARRRRDGARSTCTAQARGSTPALDLMADVVLRPDVRRLGGDRPPARAAPHALLQLRDQPTADGAVAFNAIVYRSAHPYGRPSGGNEASTEKLDRATGARRSTTRTTAPATPASSSSATSRPPRRRQLVEARFGAWKAGDVAAARCARRAQPPAAAHVLSRRQAGRRAVGDPHRPRRRRAHRRPTTIRCR